MSEEEEDVGRHRKKEKKKKRGKGFIDDAAEEVSSRPAWAPVQVRGSAEDAWIAVFLAGHDCQATAVGLQEAAASGGGWRQWLAAFAFGTPAPCLGTCRLCTAYGLKKPSNFQGGLHSAPHSAG